MFMIYREGSWERMGENYFETVEKTDSTAQIPFYYGHVFYIIISISKSVLEQLFGGYDRQAGKCSSF